MEMGQGQDVDGGEIEAVAQQGPQAAGTQVQGQEAASGLDGQGRRPPAQGGHPGAGPDDDQFHGLLFLRSYPAGRNFSQIQTLMANRLGGENAKGIKIGRNYRVSGISPFRFFAF
jgi:hypothetical protein